MDGDDEPRPEIDAEQAYLDEAYRALAVMRDRTAAAAAATDTAAQAVDSAIAQRHLEHRLASLDPNVAGLAFGRIDEEGDTVGATGPAWYVGRRHVEDDGGEPLVVDWRAPVSVPFYRATPADPIGLHRRRRFMMSGRTIDDVFDEVFDDPDSVHAARHGGIPDPLLAELERERTGAMRDIVATIQAEQDVVIRASLDACVVVQGGPGTGKTAVGLHRAAFLLYEHRRSLDLDGVLVLGPNPVFLRYISQVLPSLGESAVHQTTVERLIGGRIAAFDQPSVAALKGDARMAAVLARAIGATVGRPDQELVVASDWGAVRLAADVVAAVVDEVEARGVPHNVGRGAVRSQLVRLAEQAMAERRGLDVAPLGYGAALRTSKAFQAQIDRLWPAVSAPALVRKLLSSPTALRRAADGILDADEQRSLLRKATKRADDEPWTAADRVLVDEAEAATEGTRRAFGHVVVDEAQDVTVMEWRAIARRCPSRSMTVLGDVAQATRAGSQSSWDAVLDALGRPEGAVVAELDLGYRVPAPIIGYANRLLPIAAPDVRPTRSVRDQGRAPTVLAVADDELAARVRSVIDELAARWTTVGVVVPAACRVAVDAVLADVVVGADDAVLVVTPTEAKGLEFDAVVVVEPAAVIDDGAGGAAGARLLYIALTRPVQELVVVHVRPLPTSLT